MGKAWLYLLKNDNFHLHAYHYIYHFLTEYLDVGNRANMDGFVDGAGGSFDQLAFLIINKINRHLSSENILSRRHHLISVSTIPGGTDRYKKRTPNSAESR